jgi:pimeloyl-ACP methyl ester carboxylesterase
MQCQLPTRHRLKSHAGNGRSDKPALLSNRSHWWTIDDMVELDVPAALSYVCMTTGCTAAHVLGHSMGVGSTTNTWLSRDLNTRRQAPLILGSMHRLDALVYLASRIP